MSIPPKIWVFYLIALIPGAAAEMQPMAIPIQDFPSEVRRVGSVIQTKNAWFASGETVAKESGGNWSTLSFPSVGERAILTPLRGDFLISGDGDCEIYRNGQWHSVGLKDGIYFAQSNGSEALMAGHHGIYHLASNGSWERVFESNPDAMYYIYNIDDRLVVSTPEQGLLVWSEIEHRLVSFERSWSWSKSREIVSLQRIGDGAYFIASTDGFFIEDATGEHAILPSVAKAQLREGLLSSYLLDQTVLSLSYRGGLTAYSSETGQLLWRIPTDTTGGTLLYLQRFGDDFVVGSSNGLSIIPDPRRYAFSTLLNEDVDFATVINGKIFFGFSRVGSYDVEGKKQGFGLDNKIFQLPDGDIIEAQWGGIVYRGEYIKIGNQWLTDPVALDQNHVAFISGGNVAVLNLSTRKVEEVDGLVSANSLAADRAGEIFAGTANGVVRISATWKREGQFGHGITRVAAFRESIVALDADGTLLNGDGKVLATLPFNGLIDAKEWAGELCLLARSSDGSRWIGIVKNGQWMPLDIPLPMSPQALVTQDNNLYIAGPGLLIKTSRPQLLDPPRAAAFLARSDDEAFDSASATVTANEDSVYLLTGPGRLFPWRNPKMSFRAGSGDWIPLTVGARVAVPRLAWGTTPITVRSEWGGLSHEEELSVFRATPWWARWPAIIVYVAGFAAFGYIVLRWRTWRLELRTKRLEEVVEQRTAQLRQAQQAREDFFSTMSHEIRNPLNGVVGLCEIVENAPPESVAPRERMLLKTLRGCADQLRSILDDVLDFSRIDRGDIQLHEEVFELLGAIEGAARGVDAGLKRCVLELPADPIYVRGDCGKIRQIVTNLVSNALKYGIPPAARVLLQVEPAAAGVLPFCIRVLNTGNTIPAEEIEQIFSGYVRGEDAKRRRIVGTGLGLAVSRRIAGAMKGALNATSQNGLTEFRLDLKLPLTAAPVEIPREANLPKTSRALGIEDEPYNRLVLGSILGQLGYEVDWAADGAEALAHARTGAYDLILTDFMLPDTTGTELARKILEMVSDPKPPIIAVTAYSTPEKVQQAKDAGILGFVTKPVSRKKIEAAILEAVGEFSTGGAMELPETTTVDCNFNLLLRLPDGAQKLAEYADDLPKVWANVLASLREDTPAQQARTVHAFRSRILAVHATAVAEQLGLLEEAAAREARGDMDKLVGVIEPALKEIEKSARSRALTLQPNA